MEYTPGAWKVGFKGWGETPIVFVKPSSVPIEIVECSGDESIANAHLVAAAPDMYEACKELISLQKLKPEERDVANAMRIITDIDKALAKAEGKS